MESLCPGRVHCRPFGFYPGFTVELLDFAYDGAHRRGGNACVGRCLCASDCICAGIREVLSLNPSRRGGSAAIRRIALSYTGVIRHQRADRSSAACQSVRTAGFSSSRQGTERSINRGGHAGYHCANDPASCTQRGQSCPGKRSGAAFPGPGDFSTGGPAGATGENELPDEIIEEKGV